MPAALAAWRPRRSVGVLLLGLLRRDQVMARGLALPFCRAPVPIDVAEALLGGDFVGCCGAFVGDGGVVVPLPHAPVRLVVALVGLRGALGGPLDVILGDGLVGGEFPLPARQFSRALRGLVAP